MKAIQDDLTNEKLTAAQKHYRRKVRAGLCTRGGCQVVLDELERKQNKYLCSVHRAIGAAYAKARYYEKKSN